MKNFNFLFPITGRHWNGFKFVFVHIGNVDVYGQYSNEGEIKIVDLLFHGVDIIPILAHFERLTGTPLFPAITTAAGNHISSHDYFFNQKTA